MSDEFVAVFEDEHRQLRAVLLDLIDAFENGDGGRAGEAIAAMAELAGPHFYYEQEALYPVLAEVLGDGRAQTLFEDHAQAVEAARQLAELAEQDALDGDGSVQGAELARQLLPHVDGLDDLAAVIQVMERETVSKIHQAQKESKRSKPTLAAVAEGAKKKVSRNATRKATGANARSLASKTGKKPPAKKAATAAKRKGK